MPQPSVPASPAGGCYRQGSAGRFWLSPSRCRSSVRSGHPASSVEHRTRARCGLELGSFGGSRSPSPAIADDCGSRDDESGCASRASQALPRSPPNDTRCPHTPCLMGASPPAGSERDLGAGRHCRHARQGPARARTTPSTTVRALPTADGGRWKAAGAHVTTNPRSPTLCSASRLAGFQTAIDTAPRVDVDTSMCGDMFAETRTALRFHSNFRHNSSKRY
jgi:hypothetical protein